MQAWGRIARSLNEPDSEPKETTKTRFRRRKGSEDDVAEEVRREREEAAAKSSKLPSLRNLYNTKVGRATRALLGAASQAARLTHVCV